MSAARSWTAAFARADRAVRGDRVAVGVAIVCGAIFVPAGLVKFVFHGWELRHFHEFGLPWPGALEILAGVLETLGGALLLRRTLVVPVALLLSATMVVAIISSGLGNGDVIPSLTLAPALLLALVFLLQRSRGESAGPRARADGAPVAIAGGSERSIVSASERA